MSVSRLLLLVGVVTVLLFFGLLMYLWLSEGPIWSMPDQVNGEK